MVFSGLPVQLTPAPALLLHVPAERQSVSIVKLLLHDAT